MKKFLLLIPVMVCFIIETSAQVIHIPSDVPTIQSGIDSASTGDTVLVAEGTYYENINFKGKAITVASQFILDGDTSHISKTIIDGSQSANPDTASVVIMCSGEDTTSLLMGFTLTGGSGTISKGWYIGISICGGGVFILNSGGKIIYNTIEGNHLNDPENKIGSTLGPGILARVNHNHTAIIRNNIIRNNSSISGAHWGGGISLFGGRMLVEKNSILNNTLNGLSWYTAGAGIWHQRESEVEGVIEEIIIRDNMIVGNKAYSEGDVGFAAGICIYGLDTYQQMQIYNNIIAENFAEGWCAGFYICFGKAQLYNNTIFNNEATIEGNSLGIDAGGDVLMYNNIVWSNAEDTLSEYVFWGQDNSVTAYYNILEEPFKPGDPAKELYNVYKNPFFMPGSYVPSDSSLSIGWGRDSFRIGSTWYYAPASDFFGNKRPDPVDPYVDAGAVESAFPKPPNDNTNLAYIKLWDRTLWPKFHYDTLHYILPVPDTTVITPQLDVMTEDQAAKVGMNPATDLGSEDPADRTTIITVTASDGITQKIYEVLFRYAYTEAALSKLSIAKGLLVPEFHTDSLMYTVCLPKPETKTPVVTCEVTDTLSTFWVVYAKSIIVQTPGPTYRPYRTTVISVTAEDGIHKKVYEIEHLIDKFIPTITLASDTVILPDSIEVTSTEDGYIYLVPAKTSKNLDSIKVHMIDSTTVAASVPAYIDTAITGTYWLYAIDYCLNISSAVAVTIVDDTTGINENMISTVRLYPIPVNQTLYIETSENISSVELFTIIGVKVLDKSKPEGSIDMGYLEQGIYFIRIRTVGGEVYTGKVVKR